MVSAASRLFGLGALAVGSGCTPQVGPTDGTGGSSTAATDASAIASTSATAASTSSSGTPGDCVTAGGQCVPASAVGWNGPVVVSPSGQCPQGSLVIASAGDALAQPPACSCVPEGVACTPPPAHFSFTDCPGSFPPFSANLQQDTCVTEMTVTPVLTMTVDAAPVNANAGCTGDPAASVPAPSYVNPVDFCGLAGTCGANEVCAPAGVACISTFNDTPCPAPYAVEHSLVHAVYDGCPCMGTATTTCDGYITVNDDAACATGTSFSTTPQCSAIPSAGVPLYVKYSPTDPGSCTSTTWHAAVDDVRVCCLR